MFDSQENDFRIDLFFSRSSLIVFTFCLILFSGACYVGENHLERPDDKSPRRTSI